MRELGELNRTARGHLRAGTVEVTTARNCWVKRNETGAITEMRRVLPVGASDEYSHLNPGDRFTWAGSDKEETHGSLGSYCPEAEARQAAYVPTGLRHRFGQVSQSHAWVYAYPFGHSK